MSSYLGGGEGGALYQDWANIQLSGPAWNNTTTGAWLTAPSLTYTTVSKSNSWSYGSSSALIIPVTGIWRIHLRTMISNAGIDMFYGLSIGGTFVFFGVATGGLNVQRGNETSIQNCTAGQVVVPAIFQFVAGTVNWDFTAPNNIYLELLKPPI